MRGLIVLLALAPALVSMAASGTDDPGHSLYTRYCGACHGPNAKGDGIAGTFITPKPADLTQIAKKNGGTFPFEETVRIIDGRTTLRAHGDPDMPVWGEILRDNPAWEMTRRAGVRGTLVLITEYLRSIQEK